MVDLSMEGHVYFKSHIELIVDDHSPAALLNDTMQPEVGVYHPGESVHLQGFFLNNSRQGSLLKLTSLADANVEVIGNSVCSPRSQYYTVCQLPDTMTVFGEFLVSLVENNTNLSLTDDSTMHVILVLPVPVIKSITPQLITVPSESNMTAAETRVIEIRIELNWNSSSDAGLAELEEFKHMYRPTTLCR